MNRNVALAQASMDEVVLPARVQETLGQLVGSAKEGLLALSVGVGLGVLAELMEEEVVEVVGAKGKHDAERVAVRHGHESGGVTLGGRRVAVERPRVRSADGAAELRLATYAHFADRDPLTKPGGRSCANRETRSSPAISSRSRRSGCGGCSSCSSSRLGRADSSMSPARPTRIRHG